MCVAVKPCESVPVIKGYKNKIELNWDIHKPINTISGSSVPRMSDTQDGHTVGIEGKSNIQRYLFKPTRS